MVGDEHEQDIRWKGQLPSSLAAAHASASLSPRTEARGAAERYLAALFCSCEGVVALHHSGKNEKDDEEELSMPIETAAETKDSRSGSGLSDVSDPAANDEDIRMVHGDPAGAASAIAVKELTSSTAQGVTESSVAVKEENLADEEVLVDLRKNHERADTSARLRKSSDQAACNGAPSEVKLGSWHCSGRGIRCRPTTPSTRSSTPKPMTAPSGLRPNSAPAYSNRPAAMRMRLPESKSTRAPRRASEAIASMTTEDMVQLGVTSVERQNLVNTLIEMRRQKDIENQVPQSAAPEPPGSPTASSSQSSGALLKKWIPKRPPTAPPGKRWGSNPRRMSNQRAGHPRPIRLVDRRYSDEDEIEVLHDSCELQRCGKDLRFLSRDNRLDLNGRFTQSEFEDLSYWRTARYAKSAQKTSVGVRALKELKRLREGMQRMVEPPRQEEVKKIVRLRKQSTLIRVPTPDSNDERTAQEALQAQKLQEDFLESFGKISRQINYENRTEAEEEDIKRIVKATSMKRATVLLVKKVFEEHEEFGDSGMRKREFESAVGKLLRIHLRDRVLQDSEISAICNRYWEGKNEKNAVDFVKFAKDYAHLMKEQGVLTESGKLHACAMKHEVSVGYTASIKNCFDACHDECLKVDFQGFVHVLYKILKVQPGVDIPKSMCARFWNELDVAKLGKVDFDQFFAWWLMYFYIGEEDEDPDMPMFYSRVRHPRTFEPDPPVVYNDEEEELSRLMMGFTPTGFARRASRTRLTDCWSLDSSA